MKKIICIDDDPVALMYYRALIKKTEFAEEIVVANNGQEAIEYYKNLLNSPPEQKETPPSVILLDLNMPVMNGWEFLEEFLNTYHIHFPNTKIIILTSSSDPRDENKAKEFSYPLQFFAKPLTKEILESVQS